MNGLMPTLVGWMFLFGGAVVMYRALQFVLHGEEVALEAESMSRMARHPRSGKKPTFAVIRNGQVIATTQSVNIGSLWRKPTSGRVAGRYIPADNEASSNRDIITSGLAGLTIVLIGIGLISGRITTDGQNWFPVISGG